MGFLSALCVCPDISLFNPSLFFLASPPVLLPSSSDGALWSWHRAQEAGPPAPCQLPGSQFIRARVHSDWRSGAASAGARCVHQRCLPAPRQSLQFVHVVHISSLSLYCSILCSVWEMCVTTVTVVITDLLYLLSFTWVGKGLKIIIFLVIVIYSFFLLFLWPDIMFD